MTIASFVHNMYTVADEPGNLFVQPHSLLHLLNLFIRKTGHLDSFNVNSFLQYHKLVNISPIKWN